jgi:Tfp pilus assembly protein PilN
VIILRIVRGFRWPQWLALFGALCAAAFVGVTMYVVQNSVTEREQAFQTLQLQTTSMLDQRAAQTRRIDLLSGDIRTLTGKIVDQSRVIGAQNERIKILTAQVKQLGATPLAPATKG